MGGDKSRKAEVSNRKYISRASIHESGNQQLSKHGPAAGTLDSISRAVEKTLATGKEVHSLGDYNICSLSIHRQNGERQCLVDQLIKYIFPQGATQCVRGATRLPQGAQRHPPSGLDSFWTSAPEKLLEVQVMGQG